MADVMLVQDPSWTGSITIPGSVVARMMIEWKRQKCEASGDP